VAYLERTPSGRLRQPVLLGLERGGHDGQGDRGCFRPAAGTLTTQMISLGRVGG